MNRMRLMIVALGSLALGGANAADEPVTPSPYEVVWDTPSADCNGTMPLGNGEIALNAWIEPSGDLCFYIARTDSWDDSGRLVKVGALRIKVGDGPAERTKKFRQVLTAKDGTLSARYGEGDAQVELRLWVDANRPVICVEAQTAKPTTATVLMDLWRNAAAELPDKTCSDVLNSALFPEKTVVEPDTVLSGLKERIGWYHRNIKSVGPANLAKMQGVEEFLRAEPLLHRTFGALIAASRPQRVDDRTLQSTAGTSHLFEIAVLTKHPATVESWLGEIQTTLDAARQLDLTTRRAAHEKWWAEFWNRSWIHISQNGETADDAAAVVSRAYAMQRYMSACVGRGTYPIKFNGSLFTVPAADHKLEDADYRQWGPGYWWQNTRLPYYSMCASGDFEMMDPLFNMYARELLPFFKFRTQKYLGHGGAYIPECIYFWGDVFAETYGNEPFATRADKLQVSEWHKYEWVSGPELVTLLLDRYAYTGDEKFLRETALPAARELLGFFDQHYKTGADGKLDMQPSQALETWTGCVNPMPELAGLHATTARLLALPENLTIPADRACWKQLRAKLPPLPTTKTPDGKVMLAPAQVYKQKNNSEVPELYAVFPFRQIAIGKPKLEWGVEALNHRADKGASGWRQDDIFMAFLGEAAQARDNVVARARSKHGESRFPTFWGPNFDWVPDQDHGSVLLIALQSMLLQADDRKIYLLPAWPRDWDCEFKLHAPYNTTVEGVIKAGKLEKLTVTPEARAKDVVNMLEKATINLTSPVPCQVFQRGKTDSAAILIEGSVSDKADVIEARADLAPGAKRGTPVEWVAITPKGQGASGKFSGRLPLAAGGWYQVTVRARTGNRTTAEKLVAKVGVGEVFVTAGQSNSANFGNPRQKAKDDRVVYFTGKEFVQAQDPIPGGCGDGGSPWALLGDRIVASQQVPVCFRSASLNWTEVAAWLPPNTPLYQNLSSCVKAFGKDGVRAVLWHQGESDTLVKTSAETYCERIKTIVEALNKDAGYALPWLVAQATFHPGSQAPEQEQVAKGQRLLWDKKICFQGPLTDDLLGPEYRHDGVHFNQQGLEQHAQRWFDALSRAFQWKNR